MRLTAAGKALGRVNIKAGRREHANSVTLPPQNMKSIFVVLALAMVSASAGAQQPPTVTAQANTLYVSAEGKFEAAPDTVLVQFNIAAQENAARAAYDRAAKAAEEVRGVLRSNGIDPSKAQVGFLSLAPVYDWRTPQRKLIAYRVSTAVQLKLKDFSKVGPIVEQLAGLDISENQSVSYILEDMDAARTKAVEDAYRRARSEAAAMAQAGGRSLGELSYGSIDSVEYPRPLATMQPMMALRAGAAEQPPTAEFTPQSVTVTAHVSALFALK